MRTGRPTRADRTLQSAVGLLRTELSTYQAGQRMVVLDGTGADLPDGGVAVVLMSTWTSAEAVRPGRPAADAGAIVIPLRHDGRLTLLGPAVGPGLPGCLE